MIPLTVATARALTAPEWMRMPLAEPGMAIGLFGGSFNPPHKGHLSASRLALNRIGLDRVWWMVTPGNPLKDHSDLAPLQLRVRAAAAMAGDPRVEITTVEALLGTNYTAATIEAISSRNPGVRFVWVMGADNLHQFHRWHRWRDIADLVPIAVIDRPGNHFRALSSPAAHSLAQARLDESDAPLLPFTPPPAWVYLHGPLSYLSSTAIRDEIATLQ